MSSSEPLAARPYPLARGLVLRNWLVGTAHAAGLVSGGLARPEDAGYWRRRAADGAAMLVVGGTVTAPESTWRRRIVTEAWREEAVPGMAARAEAIRSEGAVAACQLVHLGRETTGAEMTMSGAIMRIAADAVIVVGERRARDWRSLVPSGPTVRLIGDALVPRRVAHAISEGRAAADAIRASRPHMPATAAPA